MITRSLTSFAEALQHYALENNVTLRVVIPGDVVSIPPQTVEDIRGKFDELSPVDQAKVLLFFTLVKDDVSRELLAIESDNRLKMIAFKYWFLKASVTFALVLSTVTFVLATTGVIDIGGIVKFFLP